MSDFAELGRCPAPLEGETVYGWYSRAFPDDWFGLRIRSGVTFGELRDWLGRGGSVQEITGVWDTVVRERVLTGLSLAKD